MDVGCRWEGCPESRRAWWRELGESGGAQTCSGCLVDGTAWMCCIYRIVHGNRFLCHLAAAGQSTVINVLKNKSPESFLLL